MQKKVPYGIANYAELVCKNSYFVDKTAYIAKLEGIENAVFLRPRRFGKSLLCTTLHSYYDVAQAGDFDELFGHTWIGQHPTPSHNQYIIIHFDFSPVSIGKTIEEIEQSFRAQCNVKLEMLRYYYEPLLDGLPTMSENAPVADNLEKFLAFVANKRLPRVYIIIDEYDNFANQLITSYRDHLYRELTADTSFLKAFFKTLKEGRKNGVIANAFITGVLPITIDDLASGFNIARIIKLDPEFEAMLGFTQREVDRLLDEVYADYGFDPATRNEVDSILKNQYNGYHFVTTDGEPLYNSTLLMYFLTDFCGLRKIPEYLTDLNLRTDLSWVRRITGSNSDQTEAFVNQLLMNNTIAYDNDFLTSKFNMSQFFEKSFFPISFYYLGMLTKQDQFSMKLPNGNMRKIFTEYFNELHHIDVSTLYADMMRRFVAQPNLPELFAEYWRLYVSQLPEAIFQQVNENFYRTTFFELCSRYLSKWFTWNIERSYPQGRSDLEFVGKFHECFAGLRFVIEFKYFSNAEFKRLKTTIEEMPLQREDTEQIAGYVAGVRQEYPQARISQFVIYCIGNQGFRVFEIQE